LRRFLNWIVYIAVFSVLCACGGSGGEGSETDAGDQNSGNTSPVLSETLELTTLSLPQACEFDGQRLRNFAQCNLHFQINLSQGQSSDASFVGQVSTNSGQSWQNLMTGPDLSFILPASDYSGDVQIRATMLYQQTTTQTQSLNFTLLENTISLQDAGDFAQDAVVYLDPQDSALTHLELRLPSCLDAEQDTSKVELRKNSRYLIEQQSGARIRLDRNLFADNDLLNAICIDSFNAEAAAPGSIQIKLQTDPDINHAPEVSFSALDSDLERYQGLIRDGQTLQTCLQTQDQDNDEITLSLTAITEQATHNLTLTNQCTQLDTTDYSGQTLTLIAQANDGQNSAHSISQARLELGTIYPDSVAIASASNSSCQLGDTDQTTQVTIDADKELDDYSLSVINLADNSILRELGQVTSASLTFSCQQLGSLQYQIVTASRGKIQRSQIYSHTVTVQQNQLPELSFDIQGEVLNNAAIQYRDNQQLDICIDATDADNDALTTQMAYQWDNAQEQVVELLNNCSAINTQGRGGQRLKLIADVSDGQADIQFVRDLGIIHTDSIQFATTESQSCIAGDAALSYSVKVDADIEGDSHQLSIINASTQAVITNLGSVTSGQFDLSCDQVSTLSFQIKNESRGLSVLSPVYMHTVSEQANQQPELGYSLTVVDSSEAASSGVTLFEDAYRDNSTLRLCIDAVDPEGLVVDVTGVIRFEDPADNRLISAESIALDNQDCMNFSTYYKGGQALKIELSATDGETQTEVLADEGIIHGDQINVASSSSQTCTQGEPSLTYQINIAPDLEGDSQTLTVIDPDSNSIVATANQTDTSAQFSLSCQSESESRRFYIRNSSRGLSTQSLVYQHQVNAQQNTLPELSYQFINEVRIGNALRDNQSFEICLQASDPDGDNLELNASYQIEGQQAQTIVLNNFCGTISTAGAGNKQLTLNLTAFDGLDTQTLIQTVDVHQDTVQFAFTSGQSCKIGDAARTYLVNLNPDTEGDTQSVKVYLSDNTLLRDLGSERSFTLACTMAQSLTFYLETESRGLITKSSNYQHTVSNEINTRPTINLTWNTAELDYYAGAIRDRQTLEVCAHAEDSESELNELNVQVFYRFDSQALQTLNLTDYCGEIELTNRGGQQLSLQGFASDGTATGNQDRDLGVIHQDTIQMAISNSGSCRVGDVDSDFIARIASDSEGDTYALDVINANTGEILVELGQLTAGNFSLPCNELDAIDFLIRTTSRGLTQNSLVYSHVIDNTLNAKPQLQIELTQAELFSSQVRDGQNIEVCLSATDSDNDAISYRAVYQFTNEPLRSLNLNEQHCGVISTSGRGGDSLLIQGFASDGIAETTQIYDVSEIHQDTLAMPVSTSSACTIGESAIVYNIELGEDTENDLRKLVVNNSVSGNIIAQFDEANDFSEFEFSLACDQVGDTQFTITATSRGLSQTSEIYSHTVNASLTNNIQSWLTTADQTQLLSQQAEQKLRVGTGTATHQIDVSDSTLYQNIQGFGAGLTDSAASLLFESDNRTDILSELFEPGQGASFNRVRISLSGLGNYVARAAKSYNDRPPGLTDPDLQYFSTAADEAYFLPVLNEIFAQNNEVKVDAVSWSAPGWMKDNDALNGGSLRLDFYAEYAAYLTASLNAYQDAGIELASFSLQNQPHTEADFPSMSWANLDYQSFFEDYMYPQLNGAGVNADYWIWDGNWTDFDTQQDTDIALFATQALENDYIYGRALGVAFQCYQADNGAADVSQAVAAVTELTRARDVHITSCRNQNNGRSFGQYLIDTSANMIMPYLTAGASSVMLENLILDSNFGPYQGGCSNCRALLTKQQGGEITKNAEYYAFAHFSQFVESDAVRIDSSQVAGIISTQAFKNPDGSIVLVVVNQSNVLQDMDINWQGQSTFIQLPGLSVQTLTWNSANSGVADLQQIQQASLLAQDSLALIDAMRDESGIYAEKLILSFSQSGDLSPASTGLGLVSLAVAHQMQWDANASAKVLATLDSLSGENENFAPARDESGIFAKRFNVDGTAMDDNYSLLETAYLLAGAQFAAQTIANTQITEKVETLVASVDWQGAIEDSQQGTVVIERDFSGNTLNTQGVYDQQMLLVWLAKETGSFAAATLWENHYASGELTQLAYYQDNAIPSDEQGESISASIHQLNYYLINPVLASANYRQLFASQANAEKNYWLDNFNLPSYLWGFGYGTDNRNLTQAEFDSISMHKSDVAHAPTIAGFISADNAYLDDILAWKNQNTGILITDINGIEIPWRYQNTDTGWQSQQIDMFSIAPMLLGLASHPGLLDIQFFRTNNQLLSNN